MRSYWSLLVFALGAVALVPDCTIKTTTSDDCTPGSRIDCTCPGGSSGEKVCNASGLGYGVCSCGRSTSTSSSSSVSSTSASGSATVGVGVGGASASSATTTTSSSVSAGGASSATSSVSVGAGGSGGQGGTAGAGGQADAGKDGPYDAGQEAGTGIDACDQCVVMQCSKEFDDCFADPMCFTGDPDDPGQYEQVTSCVEQRRTMQAVKRIDLRSCGQQVGNGIGWPPDGMSEATTNIINCMATGQTSIPMNNSWADNTNITQVWPTTSCAKLACTSMIQ
jgi:hypothetical protein